jgi:GTP-binding protein Era
MRWSRYSVAEEFRSGYVAVVGRPNVGKSTLVNALVGEKISIVTAKPQTTRHRIIGIRDRADSQVIFVDTPGLHATARKLINRTMNRAAASSLVDADVVLFVIEGSGWRAGDGHVLRRLEKCPAPVILVVNKADLVKPKSRLLPLLESCQARRQFAAIVPVSALTEGNLDTLMTLVLERLPAGLRFYPEGATTDRGRDFRIAEILREKLMAAMDREVPYGLAVEIEAVEDSAKLARINALIWVAKDSQRPIVVGRGGEALKSVGLAARRDIEKLIGKKVFLETHVKVRRNWADDARALRQLGYEDED